LIRRACVRKPQQALNGTFSLTGNSKQASPEVDVGPVSVPENIFCIVIKTM
jgi:hypothetical protein